MSELFAGCVVIIAMLTLAVVLLWLADRVRYRTLSSDEIAERSRDYERRLATPDWSTVASQFGGSVPSAVQALYSNQALLASTDIEVGDELAVAWFVPADDNAFEPEQWFNPASDAFVFAVTAFGDPFFVRTAQVAEGLPVYIHYHEGGDTEAVAASLQEFVTQLETGSRGKRTYPT